MSPKPAVVWRMDRLSREWVGPCVYAVDGVPVADWTYAIVSAWRRPATPEEINKVPEETADGLGITVGPGSDNVLAPGTWLVYVRHVSDLEAPVRRAVIMLIIT